MKHNIFLCFLLALAACNPGMQEKKQIPVVGFLDAFEDPTIAQAKAGFFDALQKAGYSDKAGTIRVVYRNAQGDIPTLVQACDYFISAKVSMVASNVTLSTVTALQRTSEIPICMMVSPSPRIAKLTDEAGNPPANLFGVYETLEYIDTSVALIKTVFPRVHYIGTIYNPSEPQSVDALARIEAQCIKSGLKLEVQAVNNSSETQLAVQSLVKKGIKAFFALPDNTVFSSFKTINNICEQGNVPVFTSEAGLVKIGALAAYGADMYQWGYQAGEQAAVFLKDGSMKSVKPELVKARKRVFNIEAAKKFNANFDESFTPL